MLTGLKVQETDVKLAPNLKSKEVLGVFGRGGGVGGVLIILHVCVNSQPWQLVLALFHFQIELFTQEERNKTCAHSNKSSPQRGKSLG